MEGGREEGGREGGRGRIPNFRVCISRPLASVYQTPSLLMSVENRLMISLPNESLHVKVNDN